MNWLIIFCYCILAYGVCNIIVFGEGPFNIFTRLREWAENKSENFGKLFNCMLCLPTNFGIICSLFNYFFIDCAFTPFNIIFKDYWFLTALCDGAFTSGIVWLLHTLQEYFENNSGEKYLESDEEMLNG